MPGIQHADIDHSGLTGVGASAATDVSITDSGGYFTGTDVEAALQELGAGGGGGGGGLTQVYAGYNTVGGTSVAPTDAESVIQKITLANDCLVTSLELYIKQNSAANAGAFGCFIYDDVAGQPTHLLVHNGVGTAQQINPYRVSGVAGDARWIARPMGIWLTAGDYWIGFHWDNQGSQYLVYYDAGGTGYHWSAGGNTFITDAPWTSGTVYTLVSQNRQYSLRANTIR